MMGVEKHKIPSMMREKQAQHYIHELLFYIKKIYSDKSQASKMERFVKIADNFEPLKNFARSSILKLDALL